MNERPNLQMPWSYWDLSASSCVRSHLTCCHSRILCELTIVARGGKPFGPGLISPTASRQDSALGRSFGTSAQPLGEQLVQPVGCIERDPMAGAIYLSITVVWTTVFGIGHFGNAGLSIEDRNLQAQVTILVVGIGAIVLAALFAERRQSEARLTLSKALLERERHNKFLNIDAATASIVHELRQPLGAIIMNADAALSLLRKAPPDNDQTRASLDDIVDDAKRIDTALGSIRSLFKQTDQERQPVNISEIIGEVLTSVRHEFEDHEISSRLELASELPFVEGDRAQLQQVMLNLVHNAIEAMRATTGRNRVLRISAERRTETAIAVVDQDSGEGIDPNLLDNIFEPFITTKAHGMGLGLAICRTIVMRHGGQISVVSNNGGSQFNVVLPIRMIGD